MARGLSSAVKTELATGNIDPVLLIELGFSTPVYLTNASFDVVSSVSGSSRTYLANGHLRSITTVSETNNPTKNSLIVRSSAVDEDKNNFSNAGRYSSLVIQKNISVNKEYLLIGEKFQNLGLLNKFIL